MIDVHADPHPAFGGGEHRLEVETFDRAGRVAIVATCSCLGWHASVLVRPAVVAAQLAEVRELHGEHRAADLAVADPCHWTPRQETA